MRKEQTNGTLKQSPESNDILKRALEEAMDEDISSVNPPVSINHHEAGSSKAPHPSKRHSFLRAVSFAAAACLLLAAGWVIGINSPVSSIRSGVRSNNSSKSSVMQYTANDEITTDANDAGPVYEEENYELEIDTEGGGAASINLASANLSNSSDSANAAAGSSTQQKIITTWNITGESLSFDKDIEDLEALIVSLGGYTESCSLRAYSSTDRRMDYTIRIPSEQTSAFLEHTSSSLHVTAQSTSTENVTLKYYDTAARLEAYRTELATLNRLMEEAENISDVLEIESRISDLNYTIDSYESQLRTLDNQIEYTTFHISITEVSSPTETGDESVWTRVSNGFKNSVSTLVNTVVGIFIWLLSNIPVLAAIAAVIVLIVFITRRLHKKNK